VLRFRKEKNAYKKTWRGLHRTFKEVRACDWIIAKLSKRGRGSLLQAQGKKETDGGEGAFSGDLPNAQQKRFSRKRKDGAQ